MKDKIETLAEYTYLNDRNADNGTEWKDVSVNTRTTYIKDATEQYEYAQEIFSVLGVSSTTTEKLVKSIATHVENSAKLMLENTELKAKISRRDISVRELKENQKEYLKHMDGDLDKNDAFKNLQKKFNLLKDSFDIISDEATASADMVKKLIPLQNENKLLKKERDVLEYKLNIAAKANKAISETDTEPDKTKTQPINKQDTLETPPSNQNLSEKEQINHIHNVLKQYDNIKDGKIALCKLLKIEPKNLRSETKLWISIRIKQCGWDAINESCNTIKKA